MVNQYIYYLLLLFSNFPGQFQTIMYIHAVAFIAQSSFTVQILSLGLRNNKIAINHHSAVYSVTYSLRKATFSGMLLYLQVLKHVK